MNNIYEAFVAEAETLRCITDYLLGNPDSFKNTDSSNCQQIPLTTFENLEGCFSASWRSNVNLQNNTYLELTGTMACLNW